MLRLRAGVVAGLVGAVVCTGVAHGAWLAPQALGLFIVDAQGRFDIPRLLAAVFFVTILAAGVMGIARLLEWKLLAWKTA